MTSEIFELETNIITAFFQNNEDIENEITESIKENNEKNNNQYPILDYLFSILDSKVELNETIAGYYQKVILSIYRKKTKEVYFLKNKIIVIIK